MAISALRVPMLITALVVFVTPAHTGLRGPGKYSGVVIFDRWDTCFLLSGPYITYISGRVKDDLRPYEGKAMQVDATDVIQPENPGDALIRKYTIVGPAPDNQRWAALNGLELAAESDFGLRGSPVFLIKMRNTGTSPVQISTSLVGPTVLGFRTHWMLFGASDGTSTAVITRGDLQHPSSFASTMNGVKFFASYAIDHKSRPPDLVKLEPGQYMETRIKLRVSPGQYQFLFGYGGGVHEEKSLASNAVSFDVLDNGVAVLTK
jgi:hypothetical protein